MSKASVRVLNLQSELSNLTDAKDFFFLFLYRSFGVKRPTESFIESFIQSFIDTIVNYGDK